MIGSIVSDEAVTSCRQVLTDERLDYLGERYRRPAIRYWTGVEFHKYILFPDSIDAEADRKRQFVAFRAICGGHNLVVTTTN